MNRSTLLVLAAVAVVTAALAIFGQRSETGGGAGGGLVGEPLVAGLAERLNDLERVRIVAAGDAAAVDLVRTDGSWVVEQQDGYPADVAKLRTALVALAEATVVEEKTANPDFYDRLGVEPISLATASGVELRFTAADAALPAVLLGADSGANGRFARLADASISTLIDRNPSFPTDPSQWLLPDLLDVRSDRVRSVEIEHADGERLVIAKVSPDDTNFSVGDIPAGRELQYASIANVTGNALRELRLQGARAVRAGLDPAVTSTFRTFDGLVVTVRGFDDDGERWVEFAAAYDAAAAVPSDAVPDTGAAAAADGAATEPTTDAAAAGAEAAAINARLAGWQFTIPSHIYDQMTRRIEDLLRAPPAAED